MAQRKNPAASGGATSKTEQDNFEVEEIEQSTNLVYDDVEEVPELHMRTWIALASMFLLNLVQLIALQGPPAVLDYIGTSFDAGPTQTWIPTALSVVQAVLGPIISSASDTFQVRKSLLVGTCTISFIGSAIAPGSTNVYRLIAAQALIGVGFAAVPLSYCVPSEILPRRWRPATQAAMNVAACIGAVLGPAVIGAFTAKDRLDGWRNFYWFQMGVWGITALGILAGYRPPPRHTALDHLSFSQKLARLDIPGTGLFCSGLTLFLAGLCQGGGIYSWTNARVLAPLIVGGVLLACFGLYETFGTRTGIFHHDLFVGPQTNGRIVALCILLMGVEAILGFSYILIYPALTTALFTTDIMCVIARLEGFWIACAFGSVVFGYGSTRFRTIRELLVVGFFIIMGGVIGFATIQPGQPANAVAFACMTGFGFGAILILIVAAVQLSTPHHLIATATAVLTSTRAFSATVFTAIYATAVRSQLEKKLAPSVAAAAISAGLPARSLESFLQALLANDSAALSQVPGVTTAVTATSLIARNQAFADSFRIVYIIAAPFGAAGIVAALCLGSVKETMNYGVDAPVEKLHAKHHHPEAASQAA